MNRRDFLNKKFNKLKSNGFIDNALYNEYKYVRNTVVKLIRISKKEYFSSLIENCKTNVWDVIKEVIPTKNSNKKLTQSINNECFNAENLNKHFTTAAVDKINELNLNNSFDSLKVDLICGKQFSLPMVDNNTVEERIKKMSTKKANGFDSISVRFLQLLINYLCLAITYLINCCLKEGTIPKSWKLAKVVPVFHKSIHRIS
jgi:hypothetical protein